MYLCDSCATLREGLVSSANKNEMINHQYECNQTPHFFRQFPFPVINTERIIEIRVLSLILQSPRSFFKLNTDRRILAREKYKVVQI